MCTVVCAMYKEKKATAIKSDVYHSHMMFIITFIYTIDSNISHNDMKSIIFFWRFPVGIQKIKTFVGRENQTIYKILKKNSLIVLLIQGKIDKFIIFNEVYI